MDPLHLRLQSNGTLTANQIAGAAHHLAKHPGVGVRFVHPSNAAQCTHVLTHTFPRGEEEMGLEEIEQWGVPFTCITNRLALNQLISALAHVIREKGDPPTLAVVKGPVSPIRRRELLRYDDVHGVVNHYSDVNTFHTVFRPFDRELFGGKPKYTVEGHYAFEAVARDVSNEVFRTRLWMIPTAVLDIFLPRTTPLFE